MVIIGSPDLSAQGTPVAEAGMHQVAEAYHSAAIAVPKDNFAHIEAAIQRAIQTFIQLPAESCALPTRQSSRFFARSRSPECPARTPD